MCILVLRVSFVSVCLKRNFVLLQDREKHEQLHELLTGYSTNGLPPLPELLALGRPTFDESVFQMEAHWSILVDNASVNTPRSLCCSVFV